MPFWRREREEVSERDLHVVVGLGNPGTRYARTRHNVGYMVVETMARRLQLGFKRSKHRADTARGRLDGIPILLALPVTFMNESGNAVARLLQYYRVPLDQVLVVADDLDLPFGTLRVRPDGSSGGNRGLRSIVDMLGSEEFARLRVGVGRPRREAVDHVLSPFEPEEMRLLPALIETAADAVSVALREGVQVAMNRFNRSWLDEIRS